MPAGIDLGPTALRSGVFNMGGGFYPVVEVGGEEVAVCYEPPILPSPSLLTGVRGYHSRKIFEITNARR